MEVAVVYRVLDGSIVQARSPYGSLVLDIQVAGRRPLLGVGETVAVGVETGQGQEVGTLDQHDGIPAVEGVGFLERRPEGALVPRLARRVAPAVARLAVLQVGKLVCPEGLRQRHPRKRKRQEEGSRQSQEQHPSE
nr:hypothetical protein [Actinomycetota bacterium]